MAISPVIILHEREALRTWPSYRPRHSKQKLLKLGERFIEFAFGKDYTEVFFYF